MSQLVANPTIDNRIRSDLPTTNEGNVDEFGLGFYAPFSAIGRGLSKFDLSSITAGSTVSSATIQLYDSASLQPGNASTLRVYRSKRAWEELTSTWNIWKTSNNWATAGSGDSTNDYDGANEIGNVAVSGTPSAGYITITCSASLIQEMLSGGSFTNNGFFFKLDNESSASMHAFVSREDANPPILTVNYTLPTSISKVSGVARASILKISGVSIASVKKISGLA